MQLAKPCNGRILSSIEIYASATTAAEAFANFYPEFQPGNFTALSQIGDADIRDHDFALALCRDAKIGIITLGGGEGRKAEGEKEGSTSHENQSFVAGSARAILREIFGNEPGEISGHSDGLA